MKKAIFAFVIIPLIVAVPAAAKEELKPTKDLVLLRILVEDSTNRLVEGTIVSVRKQNGEKVFSQVTDKKGFVQALVPKNNTYLVKFISLQTTKQETLQKIVVPDRTYYKFTLKLIYNPVLGSSFILQGVFFDHGKSVLKPESYPNLADLVEYMQTKKDQKIELSGHTDNVGDAKANLKLSEERAKSVKKYLVSKGISAKRIFAVGYGEKSPIASNKTAQGRQKNRRTEVKLLND